MTGDTAMTQWYNSEWATALATLDDDNTGQTEQCKATTTVYQMVQVHCKTPTSRMKTWIHYLPSYENWTPKSMAAAWDARETL
jgi:hypothetical protein